MVANVIFAGGVTEVEYMTEEEACTVLVLVAVLVSGEIHDTSLAAVLISSKMTKNETVK